MKIKTLEYSETRTKNFNNVKIGLSVEVDEDDDVDAVLLELKDKVKREIAKALDEQGNLKFNIFIYSNGEWHFYGSVRANQLFQIGNHKIKITLG